MTYVTDQRDRPLLATIAVCTAVLTAGYMAPWAVATVRGKSNHWIVFWVCLLLGWTGVGWAVALYLALTSHNVRAYPGPRGPWGVR